MAIWKYKDHWYVKVMHLGQYYRGERGYDKKEEAMEAQAQIKYKLKLTRRLSRTPAIIQDNLFGLLWNQYLKHCEAYNSKAWFDAKRYIGSRYFPKWFHEDITQIMPADIETHLVERKNLSARSANLDFEILRNFFRWCVDMGFIDRSPMGPLRKFPLSKKQKVIPTKADIETLVAANEGTNRLLILLLVYTMGRISEIRGLQWKDVDLEKRVLYLRTRKTRDGNEMIREIPINGFLLETLTLMDPKEGYVLKSSVDGQPYRDLRKKLKRCASRAGVYSISGFHQFRHYGASQLANSGVDLKTIQELLGHTTLDTTNIYLQSLTESKRKAIEML
jgi:integrase